MSNTLGRGVSRTPGSVPVVPYVPQVWQPSDSNLLGWTFDNVDIQSTYVLPTAGLLHVARIRVNGPILTNIHFHLVAGGGTLTTGQCFAALFNDSNALLGAGAVTASLHATGANGWGDGGFKTHPLTVAQAVTSGGIYKVGFFWNGTTGPTMARAISSSGAAVNLGLAAPNFRYATADASLTTAMPGTIGTQTSGSVGIWVGVS